MRGTCIALLGVIVGFSSDALYAAPAQPGLTATLEDARVIQGGTTTLNSSVRNLAPAGSDDLNYSIHYTYPYGSTAPSTGTRVADGGAGFDAWEGTYDSTGQPFGPNIVSSTVSDPDATGSPKTVQQTVQVLAPAQPYLWWGPEQTLQPLTAAQEPSVDPLAFGATGGGESFAAAGGSIVNDPPVPTANLDLDSMSFTGDPQITTDLSPFQNLAFNDDPDFGHGFTIFVDRSSPGTFTKTFFLRFSDEDIPGSRATASIETSFTVTIVITPEPVLAVPMAVTLVAALRRPTRRTGNIRISSRQTRS